MSEAEKAMERLDYVSGRKETDEVVSQEYVPVVKYSLTSLKRACDKKWILVEDYEDGLNMIPENMEAFAREHVQSLNSTVARERIELNDAKVAQLREEEYEPKVKAA